MTVTKRKAISRNPDEERVGPKDTGVKFNCDVCSADVSHTVRIRCAHKASHPDTGELVRTCQDFDLCGTCFCQGKEAGRHKRWHDYRVVEQHAYPIFDPDWGADEELLLIDACQSYGIGNWADIAEHIGSYRTKEQVETHYIQTYLHPDHFPEPFRRPDLDDNAESFQARKKARLEAAQSKPLAMPPPKPMPSVPSCHEVAGFMPGRLEFEHEFENDAETLIKDMEFGLVMRYGGADQPKAPKPDPSVPLIEDPTKSAEEEAKQNGEEPPIPEEDDDDLELKMTILDIYNERYDRRDEAKALIFDRALTDYKKNITNEKKRVKEERDLLNRVKVYARLQTRDQHEAFVDGLLYEMTLRKRIAELQEYRRAGLTSISEVDRYEKDKNSKGSVKAREAAQYDKYGLKIPKPNQQRANGTSKAHLRRFNNIQLSLATSNSLRLLTGAERRLCSQLRILPKPFLFIKQAILREYARKEGRLSRADARTLFKFNPDKINRIYDSLLRSRDMQRRPSLAPEAPNGTVGKATPAPENLAATPNGVASRVVSLSPLPIDVDETVVKVEEL